MVALAGSVGIAAVVDLSGQRFLNGIGRAGPAMVPYRGSLHMLAFEASLTDFFVPSAHPRWRERG
jgi:hypothetical protein